MVLRARSAMVLPARRLLQKLPAARRKARPLPVRQTKPAKAPRAAVSGRAVSRDEIQLIMVEIDGDWYLDPLSTMDELDEAELDEDAFHINWD